MKIIIIALLFSIGLSAQTFDFSCNDQTFTELYAGRYYKYSTTSTNEPENIHEEQQRSLYWLYDEGYASGGTSLGVYGSGESRYLNCYTGVWYRFEIERSLEIVRNTSSVLEHRITNSGVNYTATWTFADDILSRSILYDNGDITLTKWILAEDINFCSSDDRTILSASSAAYLLIEGIVGHSVEAEYRVRLLTLRDEIPDLLTDSQITNWLERVDALCLEIKALVAANTAPVVTSTSYEPGNNQIAEAYEFRISATDTETDLFIFWERSYFGNINNTVIHQDIQRTYIQLNNGNWKADGVARYDLRQAGDYEIRAKVVENGAVSNTIVYTFPRITVPEDEPEVNLNCNQLNQETELTFVLKDSYGDGWNGGYFRVYSFEGNDGYNEIGLDNGSSLRSRITVSPTNSFRIEWFEGLHDSEVSFDILINGFYYSTITNPGGGTIYELNCN